jgi:hypothetical protein
MEDIIKMDLREKCGGIDWIHLVQDRDYWRAFVNVEMNVPFSYHIGKFLSNWATDDFSRKSPLREVGYAL